MEANRDLSHQVAENAAWEQTEFSYPIDYSEDILEREIDRAIEMERLTQLGGLAIRTEWRRACIRAERDE